MNSRAAKLEWRMLRLANEMAHLTRKAHVLTAIVTYRCQVCSNQAGTLVERIVRLVCERAGMVQ